MKFDVEGSHTRGHTNGRETAYWSHIRISIPYLELPLFLQIQRQYSKNQYRSVVWWGVVGAKVFATMIVVLGCARGVVECRPHPRYTGRPTCGSTFCAILCFLHADMRLQQNSSPRQLFPHASDKISRKPHWGFSQGEFHKPRCTRLLVSIFRQIVIVGLMATY